VFFYRSSTQPKGSACDIEGTVLPNWMKNQELNVICGHWMHSLHGLLVHLKCICGWGSKMEWKGRGGRIGEKGEPRGDIGGGRDRWEGRQIFTWIDATVCSLLLYWTSLHYIKKWGTRAASEGAQGAMAPTFKSLHPPLWSPKCTVIWLHCGAMFVLVTSLCLVFSAVPILNLTLF